MDMGIKASGRVRLMILLCINALLQGSAQSLLKSNYIHVDCYFVSKALSKTSQALTDVNPLGKQAQSVRSLTYAPKQPDCSLHSGFWILYKNREILYFNRKLYSHAVDGSHRLILIKPNAEDKSLKKTLKSLRQLEKKSEYAKKIIRTLQTSKNRFLLDIKRRTASYVLFPLKDKKWGAINNNGYAFQAMEQGQPLVEYAPFNQIGSGACIRWYPKLGLMPLAHELAHAYDANFGLLDDRLINVEGKAMVAREIRALYHENTIRKEMGKPMREKIAYGEAWIANDTPFTYPLPHAAKH